MASLASLPLRHALLLFLVFSLLAPSDSAPRTHLLAISDLHIGGRWFSEKAIKPLVGFFDHLTRPDTNVINGDFFDNWMRNFTDAGLNFVQLMQSEDVLGANVSLYIDTLKRVVANDVRLIIVRGNHDIELRASDFEAVGLKVQFVESILIENNYRIEHGNRYDLFNAPDPAGTILPFGYIFTRAYAEAGNFNISRPDYDESLGIVGTSPYHAIVDWICDNLLSPFVKTPIIDIFENCSFIFERIVGGGLGEKIWDEIANPKYDHYRNTPVESGCQYLYNRQTLTLARHVQKYRTLLGRWLQTHSRLVLEKLLQGMCHDIDYWIEQVNSDLAIMSHTHFEQIAPFERTTLKGGKVVYANTGSWTIQNPGIDSFPFLRVTTSRGGGNASLVELVEWGPDGKEIVKDWSVVPWPKEKSVTDDGVWTSIGRRRKREEVVEKKKKMKKLPDWTLHCLPSDMHFAPEGWECDQDFYGTNDGCDCNCGIVSDPDCGCVKSSESCETDLLELSCCDDDS